MNIGEITNIHEIITPDDLTNQDIDEQLPVQSEQDSDVSDDIGSPDLDPAHT